MQKSKSARSKSAPDNLSLRQAAERLGVDPGGLARESQRPGFPWHAEGKKKWVLLREVAAWRAQNVRIRKQQPAKESAGEVSAPAAGDTSTAAREASPAADQGDDLFYAVMMSGKATAIDISRAAMQIASRKVARSAKANTLSMNELDGLKKTLQELRTAEADYIELEKSRHGLIDRTDVLAVVGACCSRLVQVLAVLENSIATEFSLWLGDPRIREMPADERARIVREFVARTAKEIRQQEADGAQALLDKHQAQGDDE